MKISLDWLSDYIAELPETGRLSDILTEIGLEVEGVGEIESVKGGLSGIVVGQVISSQKHPNADRLSVNQVEVGSTEPLHIVCGAPNVEAGQKVLVATVGTTLYDGEGKTWKIKKNKIRGAISEGMICAEDELGLGDDHSGIMVLPETVEIGTLARDYFNVSSDVVFDIGLTPNRSDATSHLGVASDLAAALYIHHGHNGEVQFPSVKDFKIEVLSDFKVEVENSEACPRYTGVVIKGLVVKESPEWLRRRLLAIGVRPINNLVDITNYVLHETGQPLHAFDLAKIEGGGIIVKTLPDGTPFTTLDGQERNLSSNDLMICDGESTGMCIGGVFGGIHSGVTEETTAIFLESAHFNASWIRRSSSRHGLFTDASRIFEKGSDPNICLYALKRASLLMEQLANGTISSEVVDVYPIPIEPVEIDLGYRSLNRLVGTVIEPEEVIKILNAMNMTIVDQADTGIRVAVPTNKVDVLREVDLIEEVLRIYGFNNVPTPAKMSISAAATMRPDPIQVRNRVADYLSSLGCIEMMGMSMVDNKYFDGGFDFAEEKLVRINNTSNVQVEVMRPTMLVSALEAVVHNQNRQQNNLRLFEFGYSYQRKGSGFEETQHLTITATSWMSESWLEAEPENPHHTYYALKTLAENILTMLGIREFEVVAYDSDWISPGMQLLGPGNLPLAHIGKVSDQLSGHWSIRTNVYYTEFNWMNVLQLSGIDLVEVAEVSKFPTVRRDLALVIDGNVTFEAIRSVLLKGEHSINEVNLFDVFEDSKLVGEGKKSYAISLVFADNSRTLSDKEVDRMMSSLISRCEHDLGAKLR